MPRLLRERGLRIAVMTSVHLSVAFAASVVAPLWTLLLAPLLFGVPHIASDVRYLCARPAVPGARPMTAPLATGILAAVAALVWRWPATFFPALSVAALLVAIGAGARGSRLGLAAGLSGALAVAGVLAPRTSAVLWAHGHHVVALALAAFVVTRRVRHRALWAPPVALAALSAALLAGFADPLLGAVGGAPGLSLAGEAEWLAPGAAGIEAARWVAFFSFWQAAHYGAWLGAVPDAARRQERPRSVRQTWRELLSDLGPGGVALATVAGATLLAFAPFDAAAARSLYLTLAAGHGALELGVAAALLGGRGRSAAAAVG